MYVMAITIIYFNLRDKIKEFVAFFREMVGSDEFLLGVILIVEQGLEAITLIGENIFYLLNQTVKPWRYLAEA